MMSNGTERTIGPLVVVEYKRGRWWKVRVHAGGPYGFLVARAKFLSETACHSFVEQIDPDNWKV